MTTGDGYWDYALGMVLRLGAPWIGIADAPADKTLHAVAEFPLAGPLRSACGLEVKLVGRPIGSQNPIPWPPPARMEHLRRCRECWVATGKRRPACRWVKKEEAMPESPRAPGSWTGVPGSPCE